MPTNLRSAIENYLRSRNLSRGTRDEYSVTMRKWTDWGKDVPIEQMGRKEIREFLDWVHERAIAVDGSNPGCTSNKARENLRAVLAWALEQDLIDALPRFPQRKQQRSVAGRQYLTKAELNALYFATYSLPQPRGWVQPFSVGQYWRCALVVFFNYGVDTGTIWKSTNCHEPIVWRHITWDRLSPNSCKWTSCDANHPSLYARKSRLTSWPTILFAPSLLRRQANMICFQDQLASRGHSKPWKPFNH